MQDLETCTVCLHCFQDIIRYRATRPLRMCKLCKFRKGIMQHKCPHHMRVPQAANCELSHTFSTSDTDADMYSLAEQMGRHTHRCTM